VGQEQIQARRRAAVNDQKMLNGIQVTPLIYQQFGECEMRERVIRPISSEELERRWKAVRGVMKERGVDIFESDAYYDPKEVPREGHFYLPVACQQCRRPQCVTVCPVGATWQEPDGIVGRLLLVAVPHRSTYILAMSAAIAVSTTLGWMPAASKARLIGESGVNAKS